MTESSVPVVDAVSVKQQEKVPLYAPRNRVYPKRVKGTFRRLKWLAMAVLLGIYYAVPWIRWDRGPDAPDQAILIDMVHRRAYFLWFEIWPQEIYYLAGLLILGAVGLFLATSLLGRVWCGFACPQTVWTDLFMWVERRIEGDRNARMKLDRSRIGVPKAVKKVAKHSAWLLIAAATGGAWIMYFNDAPTVTADLLTAQASVKVYFFFGLFTATTYLLAGWAREQVCTYMCPWPRFQSAMCDEDTFIVTYEKWRGEPRGKHKKGDSWEGRGDCVDCNQCVAVCPTGIDIRDGSQLECIGCALCVDACNTVMAKVGRPANLITYDSVRNQRRREAGQKAVHRWVRPRTILYVALTAVVAAALALGLLSRDNEAINVLHDRNPLFVTLADGSIRNGYTIKILNKEREARSFTLALEGLDAATMTVIGQEEAPAGIAELTAPSDTVATYRVFVRMPREAVREAQIDFAFVLIDESGATVRKASVFRGPE
jgi:cytochrome c oxidase accessory protein FixG